MSRLSHLPAALFTMGFFAALPLWFLSTQQGPVHLTCGGSPWRCEVSRWALPERTFGSYAVRAFELESRTAGRRGQYREWRVALTQAGGSRAAVTDWYLDPPHALLEQLTTALNTRASVDLELDASGTFWLAVGLVVLFALVGFSIPMLSSGASPASIGRGRPE